MPVSTRAALAGLAAVLLVAAPPSRPLAARQAGAFPIALVDHWSWRSLGPPLGGPAVAVAGSRTRPNVLYFAARSGGLWQTTDYGQHWQPQGDGLPWGDITALAVADANPNVIYAATTSPFPDRDGAHTAGALRRSADAGATWTTFPLGAGQLVQDIAIDPADASRLLVAVTDRSGDAARAGGIFHSNDGGQSLVPAGVSGRATQVLFDADRATTVYAVVDGALHRSLDGGLTWQPGGRPAASLTTDDTLTLAAGSTATHMLALAIAGEASGVFVSNDGGDTWQLVGADPHVAGDGARAASMALDPKRVAVVYVTNAAGAWRSLDGGRTFAPWLESAPAAFHALWINPHDPAIAIVAGDRGAAVTVNGGVTWSSRQNQPTGHFRSVVTDNAFPYRVCGTSEAGDAVCVDSRPDSSAAPAWERVPFAARFAIAPDPLDDNIVYGGSVERFDRRTGQFQPVSPPPAPGEAPGTPGLVLFSPAEPRTLFFATNVLRTTTNGGLNWSVASADLTVRAADAGAPAGSAHARPSIVALAPSSVDRRLIWSGASNGVVQVTRTAGTAWTDVSPPDSVAVLSLDASRFDPGTAYAVVRTGASGRTAALRTRDGGVTWRDLTAGFPSASSPAVVREDAFRRGLLFAGTSTGVLLSTDDGDTWEPLQLNLPSTPVTDIAIREADLVIATNGRGFWVLDDISPLRQLTPDVARASAFIFRPAPAWRTRASRSAAASGTVPAREPALGAMLTYLIGEDARGPVTLEVVETATGDIIRRFSSQGPDAQLSETPGLHRVVWDLRYTPVEGHGVFVQPGTYQVRLSAGGRIQRQAVVVRMDPRVRASLSDLDAQFALSRRVAETLAAVARRAAGGDGAIPALAGIAADLADVLDEIQQADARPVPALVERATTAIDRARALLEPPQALP